MCLVLKTSTKSLVESFGDVFNNIFKGKGELQLMQVQQNGDFIENLRQKLCVTFK